MCICMCMRVFTPGPVSCRMVKRMRVCCSAHKPRQKEAWAPLWRCRPLHLRLASSPCSHMGREYICLSQMFACMWWYESLPNRLNVYAFVYVCVYVCWYRCLRADMYVCCVWSVCMHDIYVNIYTYVCFRYFDTYVWRILQVCAHVCTRYLHVHVQVSVSAREFSN